MQGLATQITHIKRHPLLTNVTRTSYHLPDRKDGFHVTTGSYKNNPLNHVISVSVRDSSGVGWGKRVNSQGDVERYFKEWISQ